MRNAKSPILTIENRTRSRNSNRGLRLARRWARLLSQGLPPPLAVGQEGGTWHGREYPRKKILSETEFPVTLEGERVGPQTASGSAISLIAFRLETSDGGIKSQR